MTVVSGCGVLLDGGRNVCFFNFLFAFASVYYIALSEFLWGWMCNAKVKLFACDSFCFDHEGESYESFREQQ